MNVYKVTTFKLQGKDLCGAVVTHLPPTYEICGSNPGPYLGKLVVAF